MLNTLRIFDIVLVEQADVSFQPGFNVITGETGAGKSAILRALALVLGQRSDAQTLRQGAEKGIVEAAFDTTYPKALMNLLDNAGITYSIDEPLVLRRELSAAGKSRAFINNQLAQVSLLKAIGSSLVEMVGQHSNQELRETDSHRNIVDSFGNLQQDVKTFQSHWEQEKKLAKELNDLRHNEAQRLRQTEEFQRQLDEINEARLKEGEEEELYAEYSRLTNADELRGYVDGIYSLLLGEEGAVLGALSRQQQAFAKIAALDSELNDSRQAFQNAIVELQEVAYTLRDYANGIESDPRRAEQLDERLGTITQLKKKYGPTIEQVLEYQAKLSADLHNLEHADDRILEIETSLEKLRASNDELAALLTTKRAKAAKKLSLELATQLRSLNMPKVDFRIDVTKMPRSTHGDDHIEIFFAPNVGEKLVSVRECASGGEMSRLVLGLKALMAGKDEKTTLVFDEVDANIGGETATVVGQKFANIGQQLQLLCITHFPQVAKHAHHHIQIRKNELKGRTRTHVNVLEGNMRDDELKRMSGG
ncbi:MAG: DNA repair protein RecN [Chlamydiales bacterium]|nr:DNA repair protein RecN [Chlamydiales bacterium]